MEDFLYSCQQLHVISQIPMGIVSQEGTYLHSFPEKLTAMVNPKIMRLVLMDFTLQNRDGTRPLITYLEPGYFLGVIQLPHLGFCVVGLVSPFRHSRDKILQLAANTILPGELQHYCDMMMQAPLVNLYQLKSMIGLLVQLAYGVPVDQEDILFMDNTSHIYSQDKEEGQLFNLREETEFHVPLDFESKVCDAVQTGNKGLLVRSLQVPSQGKIGKMSDDPLQQQKYFFVCFATLISRAAIRGGLSEEESFNLSDIYCQRADVQCDIPSLEHLTYAMALDYCSRVAQVRRQSIQSPPVQSCARYILEHLHEDLRLEDLARHCGLCGRSLSLKFKSELGMGIPEYIHREKMQEAKYLLGHTDYTLTQITAFLNYPNQSYFTQIFKKYEGSTPKRYRETASKTRK